MVVTALLALLSAGTGGAAAALPRSTRPASASAVPARPDHGKLTPSLAAISSTSRAASTPAAGANRLPANEPGGLERLGDGSVVVDLRVTDTTPTTLRSIEAQGARILAVSQPALHTVTVAAQPDRLTGIAGLPAVQSVQEALTPQANTVCAPIVSEGDSLLKADTARSAYSVDGTGVQVGVLSDSYDRHPAGAVTDAAQDVTHGELPGATNPCGHTTAVNVVDDTAPGEDEGRAMAQTVHSLAPGSPLSFASAFVSETSFANNIVSLKNAGAKVIVDDVTYFDEPMYQDGPVSVAVNTVRAAGVTYFSSAANNNLVDNGHDDGSYETPAYRATACPSLPFAYLDCHDFDPGAPVSNAESMTVSPGATLRLDLQWAQPWNGVSADYDMFVLNSANSVLASSVNNNSVTQKPFELVGWKNTTGSPVDVHVVVARFAGPAVRFKMIHLQNGAQGVSNIQFPTSSGGDVVGPTIFGHNGAANTFSIAAVSYSNLSDPEYYSSHGPVTLLFQPVPSTVALGAAQTLAKPDFAAVDCVQNSFFPPGSGTPHRFCGTSDAAPHAAGVAALMLQAKPIATPAQIGAALASSAIPVGSAPSTVVGAGLIQADGAIGQLLGVSTTSTALTSSANPSMVGQTVTYSATVSPSVGSVGTVTFKDGATTIAGCGSRPVASSVATCTTSYAHPGSHSVQAAYSGGGSFLPSTSGTLVQVVQKALTATSLTSAPNPSSFGQSVTFTAQVTVQPPGAGNPTGTVTFKIGANPVFTTPLNSGTGIATFTTSAIGPPGAQVQAVYNGDANFNPSTSPALNQVVHCDHTITGTVSGVVAGSGSTCVLSAHVTGSVTTTGAGAVVVVNSTVDGSIVDNSGAALRVCATHVGQSLSAQSAVGLVVVGDPAIGCAPNSVGSSMTFVNDHAGLMVIGNTYHTTLTVVSASGPGPLPGDTAPVISGNTRV